MTVKERIENLRNYMQQWGWSAAIISGSDPHNSEYTPERWRQRAFISGFTGSAGTVIVTMDHAGLWTDSRYFIQANKELEGSGVELHKVSQPDSTEWCSWLGNNLPNGGTVGIDGLCMSSAVVAEIEECISSANGKIESKADYLNEIWTDRPSLPLEKIWLHDVKFAGRPVSDKLQWLRMLMADAECNYMLITCLDQVAWLLNIRSADVAYCPFVISYLLVDTEKAVLFVETSKVTPEVSDAFSADAIDVLPYSDVAQYITNLQPDGNIFIDPQTLNFELELAVKAAFKENIVCGTSPVELEKSLKNKVEQEGFKQAYIRDGIAQTRFFHWLEDAMAAGTTLTECDVADKLHEFRAEQPGFIDESFHTISAYGENAALPHYSTEPGKDATLKPCGLYLVDSGAHYDCGTTDITRTIPLGPTTELEKTDYTLNMKAMINLATIIFPEGTPGCRLDAVCRRPLWLTMRNYGHGTGHGVGNLLSVHEGPQTIRQNMKDQPLMPGMITSDEPGVYREGSHGIRHENMIICVPAGENEFGKWLKFETITRTYFDTGAIIPELLTDEEREWLNSFNKTVFDTLKPYLSTEDSDWLKSKTKAI